MKTRMAQIVVLLLALNLLAFSSKNQTIIDDLGHPFTVSSAPQRIISLAPNITEILFALGLGEKVIGVTRYCDYPAEATTKEKIGGMIDPNLEQIKALNPDLVLGFRGNPLKLLNRMKDLDLPLFVLGMGETLDSVFSVIGKIGTIVQKKEEADALLRSLTEEYRKIDNVLKGAKSRPRVFISLHGRGLWTCGRQSFIDDLLRKARGENIAGQSMRRWMLYNREQLIHENPEIIVILAKSPEEFAQAREWIRNRVRLDGVQAVRNDDIYFLDENLVTRPGPRIIVAFDSLARILHPHLFKKEQ